MLPTPAQIELFRRNGYLAMGPLVDEPTLVDLRLAFKDLERTWSAECEVPVERYRAVVSQWTGLWERHAVFARQLHHPAIERVARALLGVARLQLFHDHLISKPPRASA